MKILLQSLRKNKVVRNAGWIIGGKIANKLLAFVVGIFAARYLGPSNYGLINYAAAYAAFFASLCTLGINSVIVKNFVDHPDQQKLLPEKKMPCGYIQPEVSRWMFGQAR